MHSGGIIKILCSSNFELLVVAAFYNLGHHVDSDITFSPKKDSLANFTANSDNLDILQLLLEISIHFEFLMNPLSVVV